MFARWIASVILILVLASTARADGGVAQRGDAGLAHAGDAGVAGHDLTTAQGRAAELDLVLAALLAARSPRPSAARTNARADDIDELDAVLARAYAEAARGEADTASARLLEALSGPRFADFEALPSFAAAELLLASLLIEQRTFGPAFALIEKLLRRGPRTRTFGPALQRGVDIALSRGDLTATADRLEALAPTPLDADAKDALHYLRGLAAHDAGDAPQRARDELSAVTARSRFHLRARYLLGALAAARGEHDDAMRHFRAVCRACAPPHQPPRTYYLTPALFELEDLARLGLARIAHEQGRDGAAFAHYFRVPRDSPRLADALFEAAHVSYAREHHDVALDSLDQLEAYFPSSPHAVEARVLRGYVLLARCEFERAAGTLRDAERELEARLRALHSGAGALPVGPELERLDAAIAALARSRRATPRAELALAQRAARLTAALSSARDEATQQLREAERARLAQALRRARLGRVDAIMGRKRQLEVEIASLAAGRFPAERHTPRKRSALLRDDEEYWPFEGESWTDEQAEPAR